MTYNRVPARVDEYGEEPTGRVLVANVVNVKSVDVARLFSASHDEIRK